MSVKSSGSSVDKGESLKDTALTLNAYDPDVIVIRHPHIGAPNLVARVTGAHVVNAGDGKHQHPTQALLDLYTIEEHVGPVEGLHVAIVGDVLHSRVARSNIQALTLMGARVTLVGPPPLIPRGIEAMGCEVSTDIGAIQHADVVYVLRMQRERMESGENYVPIAARVLGALGRDAGAPAPGPEGDAPRPDEPRRRDRPGGRRLGRRADRDPGARRPRRADGRALRPAHPRPGRGQGRRGGGVMLFGKEGHDDLVIRSRAGDRSRPRGSTTCSTSAIDQGVISQIGLNVDANGHRVVEGRGLVLAPGFVDPHVHLRTPGREDEETIASGTASAAAGGFCAILAMPNTEPVVDSAAVLGSLIETAREEAEVPVGFLAAITKGQEGKELTEMAELADAGAAGFSDDGRPVVEPGLMRRALQYHAITGLRVAPHCEEPTLSRGRPDARGRRSRPSSASPATRPSQRARWSSRDLALAAYEDQPIHLLHLSARESVDGSR